MTQKSLDAFLKVKRKPVCDVYRFKKPFYRIMINGREYRGPFSKGDLVSAGTLPREVWKLLLEKGIVEEYHIKY